VIQLKKLELDHVVNCGVELIRTKNQLSLRSDLHLMGLDGRRRRNAHIRREFHTAVMGGKDRARGGGETAASERRRRPGL
jgi:hypothetical protein